MFKPSSSSSYAQQRRPSGSASAAQPSVGERRQSGSASAATPSVGDQREDFIRMIVDQQPEEAAVTAEAAAAVLAAKESNANNGLETSTFVVCTRVRPSFDAERALGGDHFDCVFKAASAPTATAGSSSSSI